MKKLATLSTEEPIYWPSDNKKTLDLLEFGIIKDIAKNCCHAAVLSRIVFRSLFCNLYYKQ